MAFLGRRRVAHLATANALGAPHVVPVCFALVGDVVYSVVDWKPKRSTEPRALRRVADVEVNPSVALVADVYDDQDWSRLGFVLLRGRARLIEAGEEHRRALAALRERYPQYTSMPLEGRAVIAIDVERVVEWGELDH